MKKTKLFAISVLAALGMTACTEDFITVSPTQEILKDNYFTNDGRVFTSVVAAYDPLQWFDYFYQYDALNMLSDIMADDIYCGGSDANDQPMNAQTHLYGATALNCCNQVWTIAYSGINRSNIAIEEAEKMTDLPEAVRNRYIAECMILKAYYYNVLWKFWGNIPFYDKNLTAPYYTDQKTADYVYGEVIGWIEEALKLNALPFKAAAGEEGRVTTPMAYMLYAEMVMYQNDNSRYATALGYMNEIIASPDYDLVADFAGIWEESGEWCKETIWEINYISEGAVRSWGSPIATGGMVYAILIGPPYADGSVYHPGWGFGPVAQHAYDMYEDGDQRKDGGILNYDKHVEEDGAQRKGDVRWQDTGYWLKKYIAREGGNHGQKADGDMNYGNNLRVYRYSEALLNAAELQLALTQGDKGLAYLNQVQTRAGATLSTESTLENIIQERRKEFLGEGKRYWDLIRTGMATEALKASLYEGEKGWERTIDWTPSKKYWPIPQSEMDKVDEAHKMTQNPY